MDLEKKVATSKPLVKSLSTENEKKSLVTLEKSLQVEKDFCKLNDKQIGDLELKH